MKIGYFAYKPGGNPYQSLFSSSLEREGMEVIRIPPRKYFPLHSAKTHEIDILHMDWPHDLYRGKSYFHQSLKRIMYYSGLKYKRKTPLVWTAHNLVAHESSNQIDEHNMIQQLINHCDGIVSLSEKSKDLLYSTYNVPEDTLVEVIYHGHYIDSYPNSISQKESRVLLKIDANKKIILFLGRIQPYKGIEQLIDALDDISKHDYVLLIAGPPSSPAYLKSLEDKIISSKNESGTIVVYPEFIKDDKLQIFFNACDVIALPYQKILNSGSLLLAMSFGRSVVAPRLGSIPEVAFSESYYGYDVNHTEGLKNALQDALSDNDIISKGIKSLEYAKTKYSWDEVGRSMLKMYSKLIDQKNKTLNDI